MTLPCRPAGPLSSTHERPDVAARPGTLRCRRRGAGRYSSLDDVARAAFSLLQRTEAERAAFIESLEEAEAESERDGFFTLEEVMAETAAIIKAAERRKG